MNRITFSSDGDALELWHNGQKVRWVVLTGRLHESVADLVRYCREWSGEEPGIDREVAAKMKAADAAFARLAFGGEYR